jgi:hypothetical protein
MKEGVGSGVGSIVRGKDPGIRIRSWIHSQRKGSGDPDPDPHQTVMDPQHWLQ